MTNKEKMLRGKLYTASDDELMKLSTHARALLDLINQTGFADFNERQVLAKKLFGSTGKKIIINKPFYCDYGFNIHVGENFYANYDCILLDVCKITIGNNVMFGPKVSIYTASHPISADVRNTGLEYGKEVSIGSSVWIGGNTVINPGVTIGNDTIIGAGSVVTKNIESGVIAAGNPCKVIRKITQTDHQYWKQLEQEFLFT